MMHGQKKHHIMHRKV